MHQVCGPRSVGLCRVFFYEEKEQMCSQVKCHRILRNHRKLRYQFVSPEAGYVCQLFQVRTTADDYCLAQGYSWHIMCCWHPQKQSHVSPPTPGYMEFNFNKRAKTWACHSVTAQGHTCLNNLAVHQRNPVLADKISCTPQRDLPGFKTAVGRRVLKSLIHTLKYNYGTMYTQDK